MSLLRQGGVQFTCPPERYITAPQEYVIQDSTERVAAAGQDGGRFQELCRLLEATCRFEFMEVRRRVKSNFNLFSLVTAGKSLPKRHGKEVTPSAAELDERELRFVDDFYALLKAAHYRLLTQDEWETALAEEFTFTMPVDVKWNLMDSSLLRRFWASHPAERASLADISDHIIVFHRGIKTVRAKGTYINEKIDLLTEYLVVGPIRSLASRFLRTPAADMRKVQRMAGGAQDSVQYSDTGSQSPPQHKQQAQQAPPPATPNGEMLEQAADGDTIALTRSSASFHHTNAKTVERRTLARLMPDARAVLANLFQEVEIQEPTWKDVVVLYRRAAPATSDPAKQLQQREVDADLARRNIHIKTFDDVPMADCEMIFPDKRVYMKPITVIQLVVTILIALVTALTSLVSTAIDFRVIGGVLSVVLGRAFTVYNQAQVAKQLLVDAMTERLYEKTRDSQEGVLYMLLDQMASQTVKEMLLAYMLLLLNGAPLTQAELDDACEQYLQSAYGLRLDFAIEQSLPRLLADGLVTKDVQGLLKAVPVEAAAKLLRTKWEHSIDGQDASAVHVADGMSALRQDGLHQRPAAQPAAGTPPPQVGQVREGRLQAGPTAQAPAPPSKTTASGSMVQPNGTATAPGPGAASPASSPAQTSLLPGQAGNSSSSPAGTKKRGGLKKFLHTLKGE